MERLLAEEAQHWGPSSFLSSWRREFGALQMGSTNLIRQLVKMGFPQHCAADEEGHDDEDGNVNDSKDKEKNGNNDNDDEESIVENNDQKIEDQSLSGEKQKPVKKL